MLHCSGAAQGKTTGTGETEVIEGRCLWQARKSAVARPERWRWFHLLACLGAARAGGVGVNRWGPSPHCADAGRGAVSFITPRRMFPMVSATLTDSTAGRRAPDPCSLWQPDSVHGPSAVVRPTRFAWTDRSWQGISRPDLVFYELHVGTFTPQGTFDAVIPRLGELRDLGITAVEIMPVAQFPGSRNWGYDGVLPYATQNTYGGPHALQRLIDSCHAAGLAVFLDVVYNHLGPEGNYLAEFGTYFADRYKTPWGMAINYDGPGSDPVRLLCWTTRRMWLEEFHFDGLRPTPSTPFSTSEHATFSVTCKR